MAKKDNKEQQHNQMAEAFTANSKINKAFYDGEDEKAQSEADAMSNYYINNDTPAIDVNHKDKKRTDIEDEVKNHD